MVGKVTKSPGNLRRTKRKETENQTPVLFRIKGESGIYQDAGTDVSATHIHETGAATVEERTPKRTPVILNPEEDLFYVEPLLDVGLKSDIASMEHPIYSLSKKQDNSITRYEHNGSFIEITPSVKGRATIYDKDLLLYITSHLLRGLNENKKISQYVRMTAHDFLRFADRGKGGRSYQLLKDAFERLAGTRIQTNIKTADRQEFSTFGLIESARVVSESRDGRMLDIEVKLSDWMFKAILASEILTLHPDYFRLSRPLARRLYELARKHCGAQAKWVISLEVCMKKAGSKGPLKEFRRQVKEVIDDIEVDQHFPDYDIEIEGDSLVFTKKAGSRVGVRGGASKAARPVLSSDTYAKARKVAPGYDVYALEKDWIAFWEMKLKPALKSPDAAFIAYCRKRGKAA
jgi:hypothetical protein